MDDVTWAALTAVLTALGAVWTFYAFRNRGLASGLRGAGVTLLPPAAWLTGTLGMFTEIGGSVLGWATDLVFDPRVWAGVVLAGLSAVLFVVSGILRDRALAAGTSGRATRATGHRGKDKELEAPKREDPAIADDDDLADVEEILRRRGIS